MQLEYKIKLQKNGFIITESINTGGAAAPVKPDAPVVQNSLRADIQDSQAANAADTSGQANTGGSSPTGGGFGSRLPGGAPATGESGPITIIGPFILLCRPDDPEEKTHE
jgi:hypothetical protein